MCAKYFLIQCLCCYQLSLAVIPEKLIKSPPPPVYGPGSSNSPKDDVDVFDSMPIPPPAYFPPIPFPYPPSFYPYPTIPPYPRYPTYNPLTTKSTNWYPTSTKSWWTRSYTNPTTNKPKTTTSKSIWRPVTSSFTVRNNFFPSLIGSKQNRIQKLEETSEEQGSKKLDEVLELSDKESNVVSEYQEFNPRNGSFRFGFQLSNGLSSHSEGRTVNGKQVVEGAYTLFTKDGEQVGIRYRADENGYRAEGDAVPTMATS